MKKVFQNYKSVFRSKYAWVANGVTGFFLFGAGDFIEQAVEIHRTKKHKYELARTLRMGSFGLIQGPVKQLFFWSLEKWIPGNAAASVWKKVILDQLMSGPVFYFQFFIGMGVMEGKTFRDSWEEFLRKFPTVFLVDLVLWTPLQIINFRYIPVSHRVLFVSSLTVIWNVFLSYVKHYDQNEEPRLKECCRRGTCDCHENIPFLVILNGFLSGQTSRNHPSTGDKSESLAMTKK